MAHLTSDQHLIVLRQQMNDYVRDMTSELEYTIFGESREARLERQARVAGRVIFGDILNPPEDPLRGLKAILGGSA